MNCERNRGDLRLILGTPDGRHRLFEWRHTANTIATDCPPDAGCFGTCCRCELIGRSDRSSPQSSIRSHAQLRRARRASGLCSHEHTTGVCQVLASIPGAACSGGRFGRGSRRSSGVNCECLLDQPDTFWSRRAAVWCPTWSNGNDRDGLVYRWAEPCLRPKLAVRAVSHGDLATVDRGRVGLHRPRRGPFQRLDRTLLRALVPRNIGADMGLARRAQTRRYDIQQRAASARTLGCVEARQSTRRCSAIAD